MNTQTNNNRKLEYMKIERKLFAVIVENIDKLGVVDSTLMTKYINELEDIFTEVARE